jgi:hypothetical protein
MSMLPERSRMTRWESPRFSNIGVFAQTCRVDRAERNPPLVDAAGWCISRCSMHPTDMRPPSHEHDALRDAVVFSLRMRERGAGSAPWVEPVSPCALASFGRRMRVFTRLGKQRSSRAHQAMSTTRGLGSISGRRRRRAGGPILPVSLRFRSPGGNALQVRLASQPEGVGYALSQS